MIKNNLLALLSLLLISAPAHAQQTDPTMDELRAKLPTLQGDDKPRSFIQKLLPSLRSNDNYNPYKDLKAPFAYDDAKETELPRLNTRGENQKILNSLQKNLDNAANAVPINLPHATLNEIREWVVTNVSSTLTYGEESSNQLKENITLFTPAARKQFIAFLQKNGVISVLKTRKYSVGTIFQQPPLLIKETEAGGRYKWLFEADLLTTYLPLNAQNYRQATARNDNFSLYIQVTRAPSEENPKDGLLIEVWQDRSK